MLGLQRANVPC